MDTFLKRRLAETLESRVEWADKVRAAYEALGRGVAALKKRGINHRFVKNDVLAPTTP
ncbi:MAG TPA: hypothetical protein VN461_01185 [Vicinamibacteria bacterium]|nr:hypothetical protein [Vicinamibacteria bacterium]